MSPRGVYSERALRDRRWGPDSEALTPVVGTLLILSIVVVTMAGILAWGVPAIEGLQEHAEFQSVQTQMLELNGELRNLRDPQNTRVSTISVAGGTIQFTTGDRWVVSVMVDGYEDFAIANYEDDNDAVTVVGVPGTASNPMASFDRFVAGSEQFLDEEPCASTCDLVPQAMTGPLDITRDTARIQVTEDNIVKAEAWILNVGRVKYTQDGERNLNHLEMGASIIQQGVGYYMRTGPTIKEPDFVAGDNDFFVRVLDLEGTQGISGRGEFSILVNLVDNYGASKSRPSFDTARFVRFQIEGDLEESFCNHFLFESALYDFRGAGYDNPTPTGCADGDANVLYAPGQDFAFEMSQAVVNGYARFA